MKTIIKCLFFLLATSASAQNWTLEELPSMLQKEYGLTLKKSINIERDILKEGRPLKSRADIYTFVLTAKQQEKILPGLQEAFEEAGKQDPNCYGINTMNDLTGKESLRNLMIGDNPEQYIVIGKDYNNYVNVNFLDAEDSTKTHRYAYALEWREMQGTSEKGSLEVRYIITYAKIPSEQKTIIGMGIPSNPINPSSNDMTLDDAFIRDFSNLKSYYINHELTEKIAFAVYELCKLGDRFGNFTLPDTTEKWEKVMADIDSLIEVAKTEADRNYFQKARELLMKMKQK